MRFLIVEDSRPTRNLIKNYIGDLDIGGKTDFLEADSGEAAFEMMANNHIDFVFLDWNLSSKITGLDVLKIIRKQEKFKRLPVIMVTSESGKPHVIEALKNGANDFTVKPIDKKSFAEKVLKLVMSVRY